jgi:hypothetical protein
VATHYLDSRFEPHHRIRSFTLIVLSAISTFLAALALTARYSQLG